MATLGTLKRGSVQIQRAAIKATGRIAARHLMEWLVAWAALLAGLLEHSAPSQLLAPAPPLSPREFAELVANTSYVSRYCRDDVAGGDDAANATTLDLLADNVTEVTTLPTMSTPATASSEEPDLLPGSDEDAGADAGVEAEAEAEAEEVAEAEDPLLAPLTAVVPVVGAHASRGGRNHTADQVHGRHLVVEPDLKVPLSEPERVAGQLRESWQAGSALSPLASALLCSRLGPSRVAAAALLAAGLLQPLTPLAWLTPYHCLLCAAQGFAAGAVWPALHALGAAWYPPLQRTGYVALYSTATLGPVLASCLGRWLGRDGLGYLASLSSLLWFLAWQQMVRDRPQQHPRLSPDQSASLAAAIGPSLSSGPPPAVPWRRLLTSAPVWACAVATAGSRWGRAALLLAASKYLRHVYGFALTYERVLSVLPHVGHVATALLLAGLVDRARAQALVSTTTARRLTVYIAHLPASALLFVLGYSGCDPAVPAALYTAAVVVSGAAHAGAAASCIDLAPNFAGVVLAVSQTVGAASSLAAAHVVTEGLHGSLPGSWRMVFGVSALVLTFTGIIFMALGSGSVQTWNFAAGEQLPAASVQPTSSPSHQQQQQQPQPPQQQQEQQQQEQQQQQQQQQQQLVQQQPAESAPQPLDVSTMMIAPATGGCIV